MSKKLEKFLNRFQNPKVRNRLKRLHYWYYVQKPFGFDKQLPPSWAFYPPYIDRLITHFGPPKFSIKELVPEGKTREALLQRRWTQGHTNYGRIAAKLVPTFDLTIENKWVEHSDYTDGIASYAVFDKHYTHRFFLSRQWDLKKPPIIVVMYNPSTADAFKNDPTVQRIEKRVMKMPKFGGYIILNLFALRATNPKKLREDNSPIGKSNNAIIKTVYDQVQRRFLMRPISIFAHGNTFASWKVFKDQAHDVRCIAEDYGNIYCLGLTQDGHGRHPLYIEKALSLERYPV